MRNREPARRTYCLLHCLPLASGRRAICPRTYTEVNERPKVTNRHLYMLFAAILTLSFTAGTALAAMKDVTIWSTHAGVTCGFGTGPHGRGVACLQTSQKGYGATVTGTEVLVWKDGRVIFKRQQPR